MLSLYPKYKNRLMLIAGVYLGAFALLYMLKPGMNPIIFLLVLLFGLLVLVFSQVLNAANMHTRELNRLYNELDAEGFLRDYMPHLSVNLRSANLYLMVRLHISNAYVALGRFDDAVKLLSSLEIREDKPEKMLIYRFAVVSNLCYCYEQKNDVEASQKYLDELLDLKKQLDALQEKKPPKKRMAFNTTLNEQCLHFLKTGKADIDVLRTQVQQNNTQQLHRITTSLWIARAMLAEQSRRREAENILNQIVKLAPHLYPGKAAQALLDEMTGKLAEKA